ncbi:MAG: gas vesicle protein GvpN [Candidatus Aenigmarchaeota archaeon]|nr:gas vesicle protein GvpN [Candidatus Aenigmarchaeota archaeon]
MKYVPEHPRKVRGGAVHQAIAEKKLTILTRQREQEDVREVQLATVREDIEAKFLSPVPKNFIETDEVKRYIGKILLWLKTGYPVHIIGPTGCGKTALALQAANLLGKPSVWVNGDEAINTTNLIGGYSKIEMTTIRDKFIHNVFKDKDTMEARWVSNPLTLACQYGYTLIYNEFSRSRPEANNILLSVLEEGVLELPTKFGEDRYIKVHPDFSLLLTSNNMEYAGVHKPQDALLDRIATIHMDYYNRDTEVKIVQAHSGLPKARAEKIVDVVRELRNILGGVEKPGTRIAIMIGQALQATNGFGKDYLEEVCVDAMSSKFLGFDDVAKKRLLIKERIQKML